jgi:hypothetical protein
MNVSAVHAKDSTVTVRILSTDIDATAVQDSPDTIAPFQILKRAAPRDVIWTVECVDGVRMPDTHASVCQVGLASVATRARIIVTMMMVVTCVKMAELALISDTNSDACARLAGLVSVLNEI